MANETVFIADSFTDTFFQLRSRVLRHLFDSQCVINWPVVFASSFTYRPTCICTQISTLLIYVKRWPHGVDLSPWLEDITGCLGTGGLRAEPW